MRAPAGRWRQNAAMTFDAAPIPPASSEADDRPPPGFRRSNTGSGFSSRNARFYASWVDGHLLMGFRAGPEHANLRGILHGGMIATFADTALPYAAMYQAMDGRRFLPTISLQLDYLAPAELGAWIEARADVLRTTRNMVFMQGLITADGTPIARVSGIFKIGPAPEGEPGGADFFGVRAAGAGDGMA